MNEIPDDFIDALTFKLATETPEEPKEGEFRCAICREIFAFVEGQEEKAIEEAKRKGFDPDNCLPVCDDCYKRTIWI